MPSIQETIGQGMLFEDDKILIALAPKPATSGHIQIFTKEEFTIIEQVPAELLGYMANAANKISMLLFELLKVHGTNIIIQNGIPAGQTIPRVSINIIPRRTDDGLKLDWELKQAKPEDLDSVKELISEGMKPEQKIEIPDDTPAAVISAPKNTDDKSGEKKTNFWLKSLERIP